jgi:hypothetical protein
MTSRNLGLHLVLSTLRNLAALLLLSSLVLDLGGRLLDESRSWMAGAHLNSAGVLLGLMVWTLSWLQSARAGATLWLLGLCLFGLARFLRGSAGVQPEIPLIGLSAAGTALLALSYWRRRRAVRATRPQSHVTAPRPAEE